MNRWRKRCKSWFFVPLLVVLVGFLSAAPASAHTRLVETTPADGRKLSTAPGGVSLTFSDEVLKLGAAVKVEGPGGATAVGAVKVRGRTVSWPLTAGLANGEYTVRWRVTAQDGHPIDGKFTFRLRVPVQPSGAPGPATAGPTTGPTAGPVPTTVVPHTAEPGMTGPMPDMDGRSGPAAPPARTNSGPTIGLAIAGLLLVTAIVAGAIVIERRRRPPRAAGPSAPAND